MAQMQFLYKDPFLAPLMTVELEDDATTSIATMGTFSDVQLETLVPIRGYILCCIGNMKAPDDLFSAKLKAYEKELKTALESARSVEVAGVIPSIFSVPIERA